MKEYEQQLAEELAALTDQINAAEAGERIKAVRQAALERLAGYSHELRMIADGIDQILQDLLQSAEPELVQVPLPGYTAGYHPDAMTEVVDLKPAEEKYSQEPEVPIAPSEDRILFAVRVYGHFPNPNLPKSPDPETWYEFRFGILPQ